MLAAWRESNRAQRSRSDDYEIWCLGRLMHHLHVTGSEHVVRAWTSFGSELRLMEPTRTSGVCNTTVKGI